MNSRRRLRPDAVIKEEWLVRLHKRMYDQVWTWAGRYRASDRNLGVPFWQTRVGLRDLEADALAWLADTGPGRFTADEFAVRFSHRLVVIHPFPNGNGRWSRLAADALVVALGGKRFTWGGASLTEASQVRREYITALQAADHTGDVDRLLEFARG